MLRTCLCQISLLAGLAISLSAADWPQFLGPTRDGVYSGNDLAASWPKDGPRTVWKRKVGQGFSGPAVQEGKLILFHRIEDKEAIECLEAKSGQKVWEYSYPTKYRDDFGFDEGPRATPAIALGKVYTFGAEGVLSCLDLATGKRLWAVETQKRFHAEKGFFGMACSPLVADGKVLLGIGGAEGAGIVAFDAATGNPLWRATNDEAGYSSPTAATLGSGTVALFLTRDGLAALDPMSGAEKFAFPWRSRSHASVNAATPLVLGNEIFISASYGTGAALLRMKGSIVEKVWSSDDVLSNHYATSVQRQGFLYGYHGRQESGPSLRCVDWRTGTVKWSQDGFGAGTLYLAGDQLVVLREDGQLLLVSATPEAYREQARAQVLSTGVRAYAAIANGLFYARSKDTLVCLDLAH